jgi:hypothetical protein
MTPMVHDYDDGNNRGRYLISIGYPFKRRTKCVIG